MPHFESVQTSSLTVQKQLAALESKVARLEDLLRYASKFEKSPSDSMVQRFAKTVTGVIGLREAVFSHYRLARFVWTFLLILAILTTVLVIYKTTDEFWEEPTATKIRLNVSSSYDLPILALCPAAWMDTERALALGIPLDAYKYSLGFVDTFAGMQIENMTRAKRDFLDFYESQNFTNALDYFKAVSLDLDVVYSDRAYKKSRSSAIKLSDEKTFKIEKAFVSFEICFAYSLVHAERSLYTRANAAVKFSDKTSGIARIPSGLWIQLMTDLNVLNTVFPPIHVPTLTKSKIMVGTQKYATLNRPEAPCIENHKIKPNYDSFSCAVQCQNAKYKEILQCQLFKHATMDALGGPENYCHLQEALGNKSQRLNEFRSSEENEKITRLCLEMCPTRCDRTIFHAYLQWQTSLEIGEDEGENGTDRQAIGRGGSETVVEIYVEHIATYEGGTMALIEVNTYSFIELINNVGGTLGLFIGATIMSFFQLIGFCIEYAYDRMILGGRGGETISLKL